MDFTTDKLRSLVRKWQTLIEAHVEVKTTDGYMLRMFCIGFTKKRAGQVIAVLSILKHLQLQLTHPVYFTHPAASLSVYTLMQRTHWLSDISRLPASG